MITAIKYSVTQVSKKKGFDLAVCLDLCKGADPFINVWFPAGPPEAKHARTHCHMSRLAPSSDSFVGQASLDEVGLAEVKPGDHAGNIFVSQELSGDPADGEAAGVKGLCLFLQLQEVSVFSGKGLRPVFHHAPVGAEEGFEIQLFEPAEGRDHVGKVFIGSEVDGCVRNEEIPGKEPALLFIEKAGVVVAVAGCVDQGEGVPAPRIKGIGHDPGGKGGWVAPHHLLVGLQVMAAPNMGRDPSRGEHRDFKLGKNTSCIARVVFMVVCHGHSFNLLIHHIVLDLFPLIGRARVDEGVANAPDHGGCGESLGILSHPKGFCRLVLNNLVCTHGTAPLICVCAKPNRAINDRG